MKPALRAPFIAVLWSILALGCDDGGPTTTVEPEPEPEAPVESWVVTETRTIAADGALLYRDDYQYQDGQLRALVRSKPDGATEAFWTMEYDMDGRLDRVDVGMGLNTYLAFVEVNFDEHGLQGFFTQDSEGLTLASNVVEYSDSGQLRSVRVADGQLLLWTDQYDHRDGRPSRVTRTGTNGELVASLKFTRDTGGALTGIETTTIDGPGVVVEVDGEWTADREALDVPLLVAFALTTTDVAALP